MTTNTSQPSQPNTPKPCDKPLPPGTTPNGGKLPAMAPRPSK